MELSIIIPSYNNGYKLALTLAYIGKQAGIEKNKIEIIVVDDCSQEDFTGVIETFQQQNEFPVVYIRNEKNLGLAETRNVGARAAKSDTLLFLDNDIIMSPDTLSLHLKFQKENENKLLMSRIFDLDKKVFDQTIKVLEEADHFPGEYLHNHLETEMDPYFSLREDILNNTVVPKNTIWVFGACFCISIPKKVFYEVGGFDPKFRGWGPEDIEFNYRALKKGYELVYCAKAVCYHMDNSKKDTDQFVAQISANSKYLYKKHPNKWIESYLKFYKGSISYEEMNAFFNQEPFVKREKKNLHYIGILRFLTSKLKEK